jgi:hypothetical protein
VAFDVGGVLSKRPEIFIPLLNALEASTEVEVYVVSDMHPKEKILDMLARNDIKIDPARVISSNYDEHGELCKTLVCKDLNIDVLIDDFPGYVAVGDHVRLLMMPDPTRDYYADAWQTDGSEGNFGRRLRRKKVDDGQGTGS